MAQGEVVLILGCLLAFTLLVITGNVEAETIKTFGELLAGYIGATLTVQTVKVKLTKKK